MCLKYILVTYISMKKEEGTLESRFGGDSGQSTMVRITIFCPKILSQNQQNLIQIHKIFLPKDCSITKFKTKHEFFLAY